MTASSFTLDQFCQEKLDRLCANHLRRELLVTGPGNAASAQRNGKILINFASNDYLGLSRHPRVKDAAAQAAQAYGAGAGASRLVTGNHPLFEQLEKNCEAETMRRLRAFWIRLSGQSGYNPRIDEKRRYYFRRYTFACLYDERCKAFRCRTYSVWPQ